MRRTRHTKRRCWRIVPAILVPMLSTGLLVEAQSWCEVKPIPTARQSAGAVGLNGKLYVFGGGATAQASCWGPYSTSVEIYDVRPLPSDLWDPVVEAVGDRIYLLGSFPRQVGMWEYDPRRDAWFQRSSDMSFGGGLGGGNSVSGVHAGKVIVASVTLGGVYSYDPETGRRA